MKAIQTKEHEIRSAYKGIGLTAREMNWMVRLELAIYRGQIPPHDIYKTRKPKRWVRAMGVT